MTYVDDIEFVLSECARLADVEPKLRFNLPFEEVFSWLPHPSGRGVLICGTAAHQRIYAMAEIALASGSFAGRIDRNVIAENLKKAIVQRFIKEQRILNNTEAERAVQWAIKTARPTLSDTTHFIPCHIGDATTPDEFSLGPVLFQRRQLAFSELEPAIAKYRDRSTDEAEVTFATHLIRDAETYYGSFGWIARVKIVSSDKKTSRFRAKRTVRHAFDCLHLLLGANNSPRLRVGGPRVEVDRRGEITLTKEGEVDISSSIDWNSHHFPEGWWQRITSKGRDEFVTLMGIAIEFGNRLPRPAPLAQRFLDGVSWYGEAIRDPSAASRIVKYVTAIERILTTRNERNLAEILSDRGSAIVLVLDEGDRSALKQRFKDIYDLRSRLVHGARSPHSPGLGQGLKDAEHLSRLVLLSALLFYRKEGLQSGETSTKRLDRGFETLLQWADREAAARRAVVTVEAPPIHARPPP